MAKGKPENFLEYIPVISQRNSWELKAGLVRIHMVHQGFYAWIAWKFFHRPRVSYITLDQLGSFVYLRINGRRTVGELAELVREEFGKEAEPLYARLVKYLQILHGNGLIEYVWETGDGR